jgi:type I restriction-modification system DNA methylase subunit/REP element-mobilizing transposase RayT
MALFQTTVIQKYTNAQNQNLLEEKWVTYQAHFQNPSIQENIRNAKEEQYQEGFLRDLFVNILGYTLNPANDFNLTTELKNVKDSKKADGGIVITDKVIGVIELKGTNTTDLSKVEAQAFGYKNNQSGCTYVVTSNFEKLRFYIDNAIEHQEFNLFELTQEKFNLLYLCLAYDNIKKDVPKKIKSDSHSQEDIITKQLYKDYSLFKRELFNNLIELNHGVDALLLFKKSQKLLDRFLFLFFAEDRHLLPPNSVRMILKQWKQLQELDAYTPLYKRFKKYFGYLNTGHKGKKYDVYPYNGGLFKPDEVLDQVKINDDLLYKHTLKLSEYDFDSEVDVNILGHIFENSLNEIEEIQNQLEENPSETDVKISKRKKDGVFYTPKYITKYIVENTVGKLCEEQKETLNIVEEEFTLNRQTKTKKNLLEKLTNYREWLLQITIVDPACGSGAFLNEALNFLITEHNYLDELEAKLTGSQLVFPNVENSILENNLFGVDINNESVEIAKLSLWLRTAQPNRKLNDLSGNIKCGNSLIDDPEVAGDKAFSWEKQFPQVFKEKQNKIYHITTAIHDSRTSARMKRYKVREKREMGTNPYPNVIYFTPEDDLLITQTIAEIVQEDQLKLLAYNICADHIHLLLACELDEIPSIMQKMKSITAKKVNEIRKTEDINITRGHDNVNITRGHDPLRKAEESHEDTSITRGHDPLRKDKKTKNHDPLRKEKKKNKPLWQQKYSAPKEVTSQEQLHNTLKYIQGNRRKHELPEHSSEINKIINTMCCKTDEAFTTEYKGGFDVVIGNPPYVQLQKMKEQSLLLKDVGYKTYQSTGDLYCLFYEKGNQILKKNGLLGYITSNKWMRSNYGKNLRNYLLEETNPYILVDLGSGIFESATVDSNILLFEKSNETNRNIKAIDLSQQNSFIDFSVYENLKVEVQYDKDEIWSIENPIEKKIKEKIKTIGVELKKWKVNINYGIKTGLNDAFIINNTIKDELILKDPKNEEIIEPVLRGRDVSRYKLEYQNLYLINSHNGYKSKPRINIDDFPTIKEYLNKYEPKLSKRYDQGKTSYNLRNCAYIDSFYKSKIIWKEMSSETPFVLDKNGYFTNDTITFLEGENLEYLLCLLNSKLSFYIYSNYYSGGGLGAKGVRFKKDFLSNLPIRQISIELQKPFIEKADQMLTLNKDLQEVSSKFKRTLERRINPRGHDPLKLSKKLEQWYELNFADFIKELKKKKIQLSLSQEVEWEDYFLAEQEKATSLKTEIDKTDKKIDQMVYELYGLTEEEIGIVEKS